MSSGVYHDVDGVFLAKHFREEHVRSLLSYTPQKGDLFIVSYPKCGTTWMQHIVYNILTNAVASEDKLDFVLRMPFLERQGSEAALFGRKPGALKTHLPFGKIPFSEDARYVYITRNPYDCCVSYYHHTRNLPALQFANGTFDEYFDRFLVGNVGFGDYFDHLLSWYEQRHLPNVLLLTYEDLKRETRSSVMKVAGFMGKEYLTKLEEDPSVFDNVLNMCSVKRMREKINPVRRAPDEKYLANFKRKDVDFRLRKGLEEWRIFLQTPMTGDFVRKGEVGDWRNYFSMDKIEKMKERIAYKTAGTDVMSLWKAEDLP